MAFYREISLLTLIAESSSDSSEVVESFAQDIVPDQDNMRLFLDVTSITGSIEIDVMAMHKGKAYHIADFPTITATGQYTIVVKDVPQDLRIDYVIVTGPVSLTLEGVRI